MNGFERYQHQIELLEIAIDNQCAKEYMMEIDQCAIIMLCLYYKGIYSNVHMIDNKVPSTVDAILMLNNLAFDNLRDIPWEDITDGFDTYLTRVFVSLIERKDLKLAVLRCLLDEWHHLSKEDKESFDKGQEFEEYCQKEIEYISSTPKYDVSNFSKEEAIADLETAICDSTSIPSCLDSQLANQVLTRAVERGICEIADNGKYIWKGGSDVLLAYMIGRIVCGDYTNNDNKWVQRVIFPDKEMCEYWQIKDLGQKRNNKDTPPRGHERIDALFYQLEPLS